MVASLLSQQRRSSDVPAAEPPNPISVPLITNPAAALQGIADFFESHSILSKNEFLQVIRKSQTPGR
jgi:hypothetical protein